MEEYGVRGQQRPQQGQVERLEGLVEQEPGAARRGRSCVQPNDKSRQGGGDLIQFVSDVMQGLIVVAQMCSLESHCPVEGLSLLCQVHLGRTILLGVQQRTQRQREAEAERQSI